MPDSRTPAFLGGIGVQLLRRQRAPVISHQSARACADAQRRSSAGEGFARSRRGKKLVLVGLGNPGPDFDGTRHNVGFDIVSEFVTRNRGSSFGRERKLRAEVATVQCADDRSVVVVRPTTFMNRSGEAVRAVLDFYKLPKEALLVVVDDMAIELGRLRLRAKGSAGGHNGLKSIEKCLGGNEYARLKVGVGEARGGPAAWSDHVLGKFTRSEADVLSGVVWDAMDVLDEWVREDDLGRIMSTLSARRARLDAL